MNGPVRAQLNQKRAVIPQNVVWGGQATQVFTQLEGDFMRDAISDVDDVLAMGECLGPGPAYCAQLYLRIVCRQYLPCGQPQHRAYEVCCFGLYHMWASACKQPNWNCLACPLTYEGQTLSH